MVREPTKATVLPEDKLTCLHLPRPANHNSGLHYTHWALYFWHLPANFPSGSLFRLEAFAGQLSSGRFID